jgi:energy-coupling factor transporter ATP-binding protein EcfA2
MKITKIEVSDFRGFPGTAVYKFEFGAARNLFIYGENGSGKSSLHRAIREFFNLRRDAKPFADHKNTLDPALASGHVTVHYDDGSSQSWQHGGDRPTRQLPTSQTALQVGCIDYRSLLETNFTQRGDNVNLFDLAIDHLLPNRETFVDGNSKSISERWKEIQMPRRRSQKAIRICNRQVAKFNTAFQPLTKPLIDKATELLAKFPGPHLELEAASEQIHYDSSNRKLDNQELILSVRINGNPIPNHHNILNEARLSAIGLVVYLSGLLTSVPATSNFPKLLVLDDVIVGLDMANRLPVLSILEEYFSDWQIILLTHDRVWYEMVQVDMTATHLRTNDWRAYEIWLATDGVTPVHCFRDHDGGFNFFLSRAQEHLDANDFRAASVYARAAFETKLKNHCDKKGVPVPYQKPPKHIDAEKFWVAAVKHALEAAHDPTKKRVLGAHFRSVYQVKKVVLNPLSHSTPQPVTKPEIQAAITAVANLCFN